MNIYANTGTYNHDQTHYTCIMFNSHIKTYFHDLSMFPHPENHPYASLEKIVKTYKSLVKTLTQHFNVKTHHHV